MLNEKILSTSLHSNLSETQADIIEKLKDFKTDNVLEIGFAGGRHTYTILE